MSLGEIWINVAWSTANPADPRICKMVICFRRYQSASLQNHWILVLKPQGSLSLLSNDQKKTDENFPGMRIMMKMMGGQTCSSWLLPGRHLKGFECDRLLLPCRALMGIFAESWMRAGQKILTRPWLIFYGLLVLWANVEEKSSDQSLVYFSFAQ